MTIEGKRFSDGVIDIGSLRKQKEEELVAQTEGVIEAELVQPSFDPQKVMETIPAGFEATGEDGQQIMLQIISVMAHPRGQLYLVMTDNLPDEPPFLMTASIVDNAMQDDLRPVTEEEFIEFQNMMMQYAMEADQSVLELEEAAEDEEMNREVNQDSE